LGVGVRPGWNYERRGVKPVVVSEDSEFDLQNRGLELQQCRPWASSVLVLGDISYMVIIAR
jgi:hypothetical protein